MVKTLVRKYLHKRGYDIVSYDPYYDKIKKVNYVWLNSFNIDAIIDVGASDGGFVKKIRPIFSDLPIYCFEPIIDSYNQLILNNSKDENFKAFNVALSDRTGEIDFFISSRSGCSSLLEMSDIHKTAYPETSEIRKTRVTTKKLDSFIQDINGKSIFFKIDVQGAEKIVLDGSLKILENVKVVFMEVNFQETYKNCILINDSINLMESYGFIFAGIENISQSLNDGSFLQGDAFFIRK